MGQNVIMEFVDTTNRASSADDGSAERMFPPAEAEEASVGGRLPMKVEFLFPRFANLCVTLITVQFDPRT